jgi:hypothetical protein
MVHLSFSRKLADIPAGPVGLDGSDLNLAFTDISQAWEGAAGFVGNRTVLAVSCSEPSALVGPRLSDGHKIISELAQYLKFDPGKEWGESPDIEWGEARPSEAGLRRVDSPVTHYHANADAQLSLNAIGTESCRPHADCEKIPNLYLAGDFCQHYVGMTTVEAAVVSGLAAARAIARKFQPRDDIAILTPQTWPDEIYVAVRYAWAPAAIAAKAWALATGEWAEAAPPVDIGGGVFGANLRTWLTSRDERAAGPSGTRGDNGGRTARDDESLLGYLLTPGLPARHRWT